ncbi:uncharacterized protein LOC104905065 [Beta vulgaris subsp. vulgaris]|uniref:uncharacterized protein LOC104905065 n=1 Tax=Beta vulgaris subsp. vulgaris TaxID=3555 RepID=UPI002037113C|nr:uncharacterized protein LOC104905065 [Beta vulgaris subsp. vulgaris]
MAKRCLSPFPSSFAFLYIITAFFVVSLFTLLYLRYPQQYISDHFDYHNLIKLDTATFSFSSNDFTTSLLLSDSQLSPPPVVEKPATVVQEEKNEEDDDNEEESIVVSIDPLSFPPNITNKEERMEWMKQKLQESTILESTTRTRRFDQKIQQFISTKACSGYIFMTWISSNRFFGKRELFSLESVVKAHPHGCVIIFSRIMASKQGREIIKPLLERGHNILPVAPDFSLLFQGTPAQDWLKRLKDGKLDPGKIPIAQNLSNLLRLVILYKYGGVYLDTDMIILKDVSRLRNSIGIQEIDEKKNTWSSVNNAVLIFDKEHPLLLRFMEEFNSTFDGSLWGHNGPHMASRIIKKVVNDTRYKINVMSPMAFYPVTWFRIFKFYRKISVSDEWAKEMLNKVNNESYGVHLWNKVSQSLKIEEGSIIGRLISEHCIICQDVYAS